MGGDPATVELEYVALIVKDYDEGIRFFVGTLGFELAEDSPSRTDDGRPKRWVVVRPPGAVTGLLLAQADGPAQVAAAGPQFADRIGLFLRVEDFEAQYTRMMSRGVEFLTEPRTEPYSRVRSVAGHYGQPVGPSRAPASPIADRQARGTRGLQLPVATGPKSLR